MRTLDQLKIPYQVVEFKVSKEHMDGEEVARLVSRNVEEVFKTLVVCDKDDLVVCLIPVSEHIDLKKLSKASGHKSLSMLPLNQLTQKTGYQRGGCSPIGMKKLYPTYIHESCLEQEVIAISGGHRGCQIIIDPHQLIECINIKVGDYVQG